MLHYIKELRGSTSLTQKEFANKYGIPLSTLRKWEQGESIPPKYVVKLIEDTLPCYKDCYKEYNGLDNKKYYLDIDNKKIGDSLGNWISYQEDITEVIESNIPFYIEKAFKDYYEVQKRLNNDFKYDKINKIKS